MSRDEGEAVGWSLIVPIRGTARSKSRLVVDGVDSGTLAAAFGLDVVAACLDAELVRRVVVTTASPYLAAAVSHRGAAAIVDDASTDLNAAVSYAVHRIRDREPRADVGILVGDVAAATPGEIDDALALAGRYRRAVVPDRQGVGTVLLTARAGLPHHPRFGPSSRLSHRAWGYREVELDAGSRLRDDIDTADDLARGLEHGLGTETRRVLAAPSSAPARRASRSPEHACGTGAGS